MSYPGQSKVCLIGQETTWGTAVTADKDIGLVQEMTDNLSREIVETGSISSIETQKITTGIVDIGFSTTVNYQHGRLLEYIFGTVAHAETTSDWKHTFTISNSPPSATIESSENLTTDTVLKHEGMLVESAELSIELNDVLKLKTDWKGQSTTSSASASSASESTLVVFPHSLVTISINEVAATEVQNFSFAINKTVSRAGSMGHNIYQSGHGTELKIEFSGQIGFDDKTYQELFLGGTTPSDTSDPTSYEVELDATNGVALGSGNRRLLLTLENCHMDKADISAQIGNLIFMDISGKGTLKECYSVDNISNVNW